MNSYFFLRIGVFTYIDLSDFLFIYCYIYVFVEEDHGSYPAMKLNNTKVRD